ncbi:MAG: nitroreductase family protein [Acidobacteriota bacterium]|nr:nitroreductase family protein [Acidobacteriota bacterium]
MTAGTAPSGANIQPWRFVVVTEPLRCCQAV